jgi:hypothetical protein
MTTEVVYLGRDNTVDLLLKADGSAQDLSGVTRMVLVVGETEIDSDLSPDAFDWDTGTTGKVVLALGDESLSEGTYTAWLVVYDASNPDGIVWGSFTLKVMDIDS